MNNSLATSGFLLGTSFASGLNLYATVAVLGLLHRFEVIRLPASLQVLVHPAVIGLALVLYGIEFFADKVPYLDNAWDLLHTFIRPPAAALLAYSAFGDVPELWRIVAAILAGSVALTSHGTKASIRAAVNTSPEPFSNSVVSLAEDGLAVFLSWMAAAHPLLTALIVGALLVISVYLLVKFFGFLFRLAGRAISRLQTRFSQGSASGPESNGARGGLARKARKN